MHSRSLCPENTEVHPALLSHRPVNLFPLTASPVSGSPSPPISSLPSSILTRPSSRCDLLISHVLMLSPPCLCQRQGTLGPGICSGGPELAHCGHISESQPSQPGCSSGTLPQPQYRRSGRNSFHAAFTATCLQLQIPVLLQAQAASQPRTRLDPHMCPLPALQPQPPAAEPQKGKTSALFASLSSFTSCKRRLPIPFPWLRLPESPPGWH